MEKGRDSLTQTVAGFLADILECCQFGRECSRGVSPPPWKLARQISGPVWTEEWRDSECQQMCESIRFWDHFLGERWDNKGMRAVTEDRADSIWWWHFRHPSHLRFRLKDSFWSLRARLCFLFAQLVVLFSVWMVWWITWRPDCLDSGDSRVASTVQ